MSARDVETIRAVFDRTLRNMTEGGVRHPDGWVNNASNFLHAASLGAFGQDYRACKDQAEFMAAVLNGVKLDDPWLFEPVSSRIGHHTGVYGRSSNAGDPLLTIDPWKGELGEQRRPEGTEPNPADKPLGAHSNGLPHHPEPVGTPVMCPVCLKVHGGHDMLGGVRCWCGVFNNYAGLRRH